MTRAPAAEIADQVTASDVALYREYAAQGIRMFPTDTLRLLTALDAATAEAARLREALEEAHSLLGLARQSTMSPAATTNVGRAWHELDAALTPTRPEAPTPLAGGDAEPAMSDAASRMWIHALTGKDVPSPTPPAAGVSEEALSGSPLARDAIVCLGDYFHEQTDAAFDEAARALDALIARALDNLAGRGRA